jgi:hypothetical protein
MRIIAVTLTMCVMWVASPGVRVARAADPGSDIPGLDLPSPVVAGRLGGAIYDVVYHVTVPPGFVIAASLTGAPGTDFDMYLFDSTATTVLSKQGLLKESIGPTSTESISWPSRLGGTYFIDLNGATDLEGDFRLTVQTVPDPTPPVVSMALADSRPSTNQTNVPVALVASDDLSGVPEMAFSADGVTFGEWLPFTRSSSWNFSSGDGPKTLWVKVRNGVGLESPPAGASITLDTVAPSVSAVVPSPGSSVSGLRPSFKVTFDESIDPATWADLGLIVQSATAELVNGAYAYDSTTRTASFVPSAAMSPGSTYLVTIGNVEDLAGNRIAPVGSWTVVPLAPTSIAASVSPRAVPFGGTARVDLNLIGAPSLAVVEVSAASGSSGAFLPVATVDLLNSRGTLAVTPGLNTTYRFNYPGEFGVAPASVDVRVLVRRSVELVGQNAGTTSNLRVGGVVTLTAVTKPAAGGVSVSFRLYRFDRARRVWTYAGSFGRRTNAAGRATLSWAPSQPGSYYWRASVGSSAEFANNMSGVYRWTVIR